MNKKLTVFGVGTVTTLMASSAMAQDVSAAAGDFSTAFSTNAALIGGALIAAAFIAIGYKWVKAMIFGG